MILSKLSHLPKETHIFLKTASSTKFKHLLKCKVWAVGSNCLGLNSDPLPTNFDLTLLEVPSL